MIYRKSSPFDKLEGPYSSVQKGLCSVSQDIQICHVPIEGFNDPITYGSLLHPKDIHFPKLLGKIAPLKYCLDTILIASLSLHFLLSHREKNRLIIGIDPLSCLSLALLRKIFNFTLVFYSVDFNKNRFQNRFLQKIYEWADEISTRVSDQSWVVCESLKDYKQKNYGVDSWYIPNSTTFDDTLFNEKKHLKTGKKIAWTGTLLTDRQFDILFGVLRGIQTLKPEAEFFLAPINNHEKFEEYGKKYTLRSCTILHLHSRREWQEFAVTCDVGVAIYDEQFGSTEFIEPLKIWDFLLCGMPFIISGEPSISTPLQNSGVVYRLEPSNTIPKDDSLKRFLEEENIKTLQPICIELAQEYSIKNQIEKTLSTLNEVS